MKIHDTSDLTHRKHYKTWKFTSFLPMESRPFTTGPGLCPFGPRLGPTGGADRKHGGAHVIGLGQQLRIPLETGRSRGAAPMEVITHQFFHQWAMASIAMFNNQGNQGSCVWCNSGKIRCFFWVKSHYMNIWKLD